VIPHLRTGHEGRHTRHHEAAAPTLEGGYEKRPFVPSGYDKRAPPTYTEGTCLSGPSFNL